ncbi:NACHT domain-containing protein [Streptomyces chrestomyceticus]|uniref:NACHT domain-containing protein n=1 Tax=Streptomyces chrestomyceticus TaxID=68185 RepID=UPI003688B6ED
MAREGIGGRGNRRRWLWLGVCAAALLATSLAYAVRQVWIGKLEPQDTAAVLGLPIAVAALLAGVLALRRAPEGDLANQSRGWAATLATQVKKSEERQWRQLLGDDTQRINLAFTVRAAPARTATVPADAGRLFDGTPTVPDVAAYYRQTRPRRLVVTGAPGAGKTVLALELMLVLLEEHGEDDPVPVRVSLAEWDTRTPLPELLVRRLVDVYDWDPARADALVRHHRVLPVLDGLDEMDPTQPDGAPSPDAPRALAALDALNAYQEGRDAGPLVLTCRTAHYDALAPRTQLLDAARIDIDAVPALDAHAYLLSRTSTPARWEPVLTALRDDPTGPLATTLSTPWRLCLAATVYARDSDPAELLQHTTPEELDEHLLARFIPAASALYPHRRYDAARVHRWLARLATHLDAPPGPAEPLGAGPGTDLVLHELWPAAGRLRVRIADALLTVSAVALLSLLVGQILYSTPSPIDPETEVATDSAVLVCMMILVGFAGWGAARARLPAPRHLQWKLLNTRSGRRRFATGLRRRLLMGLLWGMAGGLLFTVLAALSDALPENQYVMSTGIPFGVEVPGVAGAPLAGLAFGCLSGIVGGILGGIVDGASGEPAAVAMPRAVMRGTVPGSVMAGIASGFTGWLLGLVLTGINLTVDLRGTGDGTFLWMSEVLTPLATGQWQQVTESITETMGHPPADAHAEITVLHLMADSIGGLAVGLVAGLAAGLTKAGLIRRYAVFLICARGKLPWRPGVFLDWCCASGLMRLSGTAYQFRHRELQQWLSDHPNRPAPGGS